ncbi:hypothetical protein B0H13DRAFT_2303294 [Mycena leptocephala]|nr:hypothetical protein B0H13DRAFT_2303294 [Mycena leptocephala]
MHTLQCHTPCSHVASIAYLLSPTVLCKSPPGDCHVYPCLFIITYAAPSPPTLPDSTMREDMAAGVQHVTQPHEKYTGRIPCASGSEARITCTAIHAKAVYPPLAAYLMRGH